MPFANVGQFTPEEFEEAIENKDPIKIRVALFYDGTLNNRVNITEREKHELGIDLDPKLKKYDKYTKSDSNSYDNGRTNIAIMEPHLMETAENYDVFLKTYIEGQGTFDLKGDSLVGYALGGGASGVADRADEGISRAVNLIWAHEEIDKEQHYIEQLTIDVFGFSRGAATARYAIHVTLEGRGASVDEFSGEVMYQWDPIFIRLQGRGYVINQEAAKICFAGLYDTVLSYYGSQWFKSSGNRLEQAAVVRAQKALHLVSADEHRSDFPLHKISSAVDAGTGEEYYLPGVHSDVGGSYNLANEKKLLTQTGEKEYMRTSSEGIKEGMSIHDTSTKGLVLFEHYDRERLEKDRADLIAQGWYLDSQIKIWVTGWDEDDDPAYYALCVKRPDIRSAYCNIPLKIMAKAASDTGVKLSIDPELEKRANIILSKEDDLVKFEEKINAYIKCNKKSKAKDWTSEDAMVKYPELKAIRNRHFHFSSKPGMGYSPNFSYDYAAGKYRRTRYEYIDNEDG